MTTDKNEHDDLFAARVNLGLRELDGVESAPDVAASVAKRLAEPDPRENRSRISWLTIAAALLGVAVTATMLAQPDWGDRNNPANSQSQDPKGPWRLVYEMPIDELQRSLRDNKSETLEQLLDRCVTSVANRLGASGVGGNGVGGNGVGGRGVGGNGVVSRSGATNFTIDLDDASVASVAKIRAMVEVVGQLEMRMLAYEDYNKDGVQFDLKREAKQLQEWLDAGGRERLLANGSAIDDYRPISKHLKWFVHRMRSSADRPGKWQFRYLDIDMGSVFASDEADWNNGVIPAHIKAKPIAEQFVIELMPVNMHEQHFSGADFDHTATGVVEAMGAFGLEYKLREERAVEYSNWTEEHIKKASATLWNGELHQAPIFQSRITRRGIISGLERGNAELIKSVIVGQLPAVPRLVKSEARDGKK